MLWESFSDRTKGLIDSVGYLLFFLPTMAVLFWISVDDFFYSMSINERSNTTSWQPILWPLRGVIPLACLLLFIQGISELMKSLWAARTGAVPGPSGEARSYDRRPQILGLVMLFGMITVIFVGFPISFTLLFLAWCSAPSAWPRLRPSTSPTCRSGGR